MKNKKCFVKLSLTFENKYENWISDISFALKLEYQIVKEKVLKELKKSMDLDGVTEISSHTIVRLIPKRYKFYVMRKNQLISVATLANRYANRDMLILTRNRKNNMQLTWISNGSIIDSLDPSRAFVDCFWIIKGKKITDLNGPKKVITNG